MKKQAKAKIVHRQKASESVRERAAKLSGVQTLPRTSKLKGKIFRPLSVISRVAHKEYNPVPVPKNKFGKVLGKRFNLIPRFIVDAWIEVKRVSWPSRKDALRLTLTVVVFAVIFAVFVQIFGFLFERLFKYILIS